VWGTVDALVAWVSPFDADWALWEDLHREPLVSTPPCC
jgi:hypothetical protein